MKTIYLILLFACSMLPAQSNRLTSTAGAAPWKLEFLLGDWVGSSKDTPHCDGSGNFSFERQLNQSIVVRKNHAEYSSGVKHDDLMVLYLENSTNRPKAIFFDTEGHTIHYDLRFPLTNNVVFESEASQPGPRYRPTYTANGSGVDGRFEVALPGADFKTYLQWSAVRPSAAPHR